MRKVTSTEAARQFSELLNQIHYQGASFLITRNGEDVGVLTPVARSVTLADLRFLVDSLRTDESFAEDLAKVQAEQPPLVEPWLSL